MADLWVGPCARWRALPPLAVSATIAALCYLATIAVPARAAQPCGWPVFALAALASLPLAFRDRCPITVAAVVGAGTVGLASASVLMAIPLPYGQLVATYTVASLAAPLWRRLAIAATVAGVTIVVLLVLGRGAVSLGMAALPFAMAYALGSAARAQRDRTAVLEERAQGLASAADAVAARERERIAREIHDIVAHSVSLMMVQAEAGLMLADGVPSVVRRFGMISAAGREAVDQLDGLLGVLREGGPIRHPQPGLDQLPELAGRARLAGLDAELVRRGEPQPVPADLAATVYRLVQEAVTNTIKHARARRLRICLSWHESALDIEVTDDGRGGAAPAGAGSGRGLAGMGERVRAFGGELHAGPGQTGAGFRISAVLPLPGRPAPPGPRQGRPWGGDG